MLIQFSVANFFSFKDKQTLSTLASTDKRLSSTNIFNVKNKNYSKVNIIYGANASGKTSFFNAIQFVRHFVSVSNLMLDNTTIPTVNFEFDEDKKKAPSEFEFIFVKNDTKYNYSFACDKTTVYSERLDIYENDKPKLIFERSNINDYRFTSYKTELEEIKDKNTKNKLFLCTAATWNFIPAKPVIEFFLNDLVVEIGTIPNDEGTIIPYIEKFKQDGTYEEYKKFCLQLLMASDLNISDFEIEIKTKEIVDLHPLIQPFVANAIKSIPVGNAIPPLKELRLTTVHKYEKDGKEINGNLNFTLESLGTQALFKLAPILFDVLKNGKVFIIDEIDRSLHPLLVQYIITLFASENNKGNAQLICNTHNTNLLDLNLVRRDEIWFTEKDVKTGASELYPLTDFSPRADENIEKGYLLGRYGAIPYIIGKVNLWQE